NHHLKSDKELELRFAVVLLMDNYITDEYIDMVLDVLAKVKHDGYYVKMAVAWAISVCFVKYKDKTFELLKSGKLDDDTYKKTFRKIVESNRVDKDTKTQIYYLKNL
ncbi:MAG: DNA alkylation repair protein, partial [Oscillospiraceae bacterium]